MTRDTSQMPESENDTSVRQSVRTDSVADGLRHALDPRFIRLHRLQLFIVTCVIAFAGGVPLLILLLLGKLSGAFAILFVAVWGFGVAVMVWVWLRWPAIAYRHASWRVHDQGMEIRRGVFWRTVIDVPRTRVQHTDVSQGPLERNYGLGTLVVHTAGTQHARVFLRGLEHGVALRIRDHLLPTDGHDAV